MTADDFRRLALSLPEATEQLACVVAGKDVREAFKLHEDSTFAWEE